MLLNKSKKNAYNVLKRYYSTPHLRNIEVVGEGLNQRSYLLKNGVRISPWHDLPLQMSSKQDINTYTTFFEIPKGTTAKLEIATKEEQNPVKQDTKKNKQTGERELRHYGIVPPFNYGMIPETWENSKHQDKTTGCFGDNDPLDVVELSQRVYQTGEYDTVRVLGSICLIDQGELDWKILTFNNNDAQLQGIKNIDDYNREYPGAIKQILEWFRTYKTYEGKPENTFGYGGKVLSVEKTLDIICDNYGFYKKLVSGKIPNETNLWLGRPKQ